MYHVLSTRFSKMEKKCESHQNYNLAGAVPAQGGTEYNSFEKQSGDIQKEV